LAATWNTLGESRKRKWIALATNYSTLSPAEQVKLHSRMTEWASLSQQQRTQARLNYSLSKNLTPNEKTATWQAYQALSPEEKQKLANSGANKPVGAAAAVKTVPTQKLAVVPVTRQKPKDATKTGSNGNSLNHIPQPARTPAPAESASAAKN
jgi:hypothetical protein